MWVLVHWKTWAKKWMNPSYSSINFTSIANIWMKVPSIVIDKFLDEHIYMDDSIHMFHSKVCRSIKRKTKKLFVASRVASISKTRDKTCCVRLNGIICKTIPTDSLLTMIPTTKTHTPFLLL